MAELYERLGGDAGLLAAVDRFYAKVLVDPLLSPFFASLDMGQQTAKQVAFMTRAFGGPEQFRGRDLGTAHGRLVREMGLNDVHFDAIVKHLELTLREIGAGESDIAEVLGIVSGTRDTVLGRQT